MRTPTAPRVRTNQACSSGSSIVSIGATAPPTRVASSSAGSSIAPKWRPTKIDGAAGRERLGDDLRRLDHDPALDVGRAQRRRPGDLEVVARGMAVGEPDQALEGARVGRGRAGQGVPRPSRGQPARRPAAGCAAPGRRARGSADTTGRPPSSASAHERPLGQAAGQPRGGAASEPGGAASRRRPATVRRTPGAGPGSAMPDCISAARRSRSAASSGVAGQIGLKLYHCSGAAAIVAARASAIAWVARCSSAGSSEATSIGPGHVHEERVVGPAPDGDRQDARAGLRRERRRPGRQRGPVRRTGAPGCRRRGSPSRRAGRASRAGAARRRSRAGCARR